MPSAARVLQILELLGLGGEGLRAVDLAQRLQLPKSSTHLLLSTLAASGWIEFDETNRLYTIGLRAWEVGQGYQRAKSLIERAQPHMNGVRDALQETVRLAVLDGTENVYIGQSDGNQALVLDTKIGSRLPAYATGLGKVLLADLSVEELTRRFRSVRFEQFTPNTVTSLDALIAELDGVRRRGYGEDHGEYVLGVRCVAVPVRDWSGRTVAAMSVSVPSVRFQRSHRSHALQLLVECAEQISRELGATPGYPRPNGGGEAHVSTSSADRRATT